MDFKILHLPNEIVHLDPELQHKQLAAAFYRCNYSMHNDPLPAFAVNSSFCPRTWDRISCWNDTLPGVTVKQKCANYINRFNTSEYATKTCMEDGTWYVSEKYNTTWTNYSQCVYSAPSTEWLEGHLHNIKMMSSVGYGLSLVSLVLAVITMLYFKKLHCPRNTVHINLFISFILRALFSFLKESLFVNGAGLDKDVEATSTGQIAFVKGGTHWECKLLMVLFNYTLSANYMWVFVEGLYLHMLIFVSVFSERSRVHSYIMLGWGAPLLFVVPWIVVRATLEDKYCWNIHDTDAYLWILQGPIAVVIVINFFFFLNIVRVLFTKLKASNTPETRNYRYRKLAKSTLVLIPLFGVHYMVFLGIQYRHVNAEWELVKLYFEMFFNSFQGLLVAILFCFLNGEVRSEFRKKWHRFKLRRGSFAGGSFVNNSTYNTSHTYVVQNRPTKTSQSSNSGIINEKVEYTAVPNGCVTNSLQLSSSTDNIQEKETESKFVFENESKNFQESEIKNLLDKDRGNADGSDGDKVDLNGDVTVMEVNGDCSNMTSHCNQMRVTASINHDKITTEDHIEREMDAILEQDEYSSEGQGDSHVNADNLSSEVSPPPYHKL